ncbi:hypothetical protein [Paenibacillus ginsengarvi]|uniref:Uncharacterized protein n=1 Tax=Paenibacillus ginsengarvi TaxID=400777 RepID=A0A3B0C8B8_9BACL|nr:hypothetical protein [Paenibacillus ginsengarvi]RKN80684.1 hypothetical protein D7M11_19590 [Paenibacillus ginsengarvi]
MEANRQEEKAVVSWETAQKEKQRQDEASSGGSGNVVSIKPAAAQRLIAEPSVVTRAMPGADGGAKPAATVIYVGSGFWATAKSTTHASTSIRMAA